MASNRTSIDIKMDGLEKLIRDMNAAGRKIENKLVAKAARAGAKIALADARLNAPVDTGFLKSSLVLRADRSRKKGKRVFMVTTDANKSLQMLSETKDGKQIFYPAVQEYGYVAKGGQFVPGFRYMRNSIDNNKSEIEAVVIDTLIDELEKDWRG